MQTLDGINDITLLKAALEEMGFTVRLVNQSLAYSGVYKATGFYHSGSYDSGVLKSQDKLDIPALRKYVGVANLKKNAASHKWKLTPVKGNPFKFEAQK